MNADISGVTIVVNQTPTGAHGQARARAPAPSDSQTPGSGLSSFQALLGAIEFAPAGPTGPAFASDTVSSDAAEPHHMGPTPLSLNADAASDATTILAWPPSSMPILTLVPVADVSDQTSSTGALFATRHPTPLGNTLAPDALARDSMVSSGIGTADANDDPGPESAALTLAAPTRKAVPWLAASGGAESAMSDKQAAGGSPRDFLARIEAARVASEADAGAGQGRAVSFASNGTAQALIAAQVEAEGSGLRANSARRPPERFGPRSVAAAAAAAGATPGAEGVSPGTSHGASPVYSPGSATPVPATAVAEKLHHWVSRGVQNAQLQLDAFGGGSVDVSISVMGQETIVDFRTDHAQARSLLLEAMPQLKEMLEREGLVFSGGFVGESGQRDSGSQRREEAQQNGRDGSARAGHVMAAGTPASGRHLGATGASIDLFV